MFRGKKITDPLVFTGNSGERTSHSDNSALAKVWTNFGIAKSELRRIEHQLSDVDHRLGHLNETLETSIKEYPDALEDRLDSRLLLAEQHQYPSGAVVDRYGRSAYLRSKTNRKICRLDDKYCEDEPPWKRNCGVDTQNPHLFQNCVKGQHSSGFVMGSRNKEKEVLGTKNRAPSPKRVDFNHRLDMREVNLDGTYTDLAIPGGVGARPNSPSTIGQSTLTDSTAIRETDIRFLNSSEVEARWNNPGAGSSSAHKNKLTHVSVTVPGSSRTTSNTGGGVANKGSTQYALPPPLQSLGQDRAGQDPEQRWETGSVDSEHSEDRPTARKFKGSIKNLDQDGLAKLKEKIRKQQEKVATPASMQNDNMMENDNGIYETLAVAKFNGVPHRHLHDDLDPIVSSATPEYAPADGAISKQPKVRKVASAPPAPSYKGFSETEVHYKLTRPKPMKAHDIKKRAELQKKIKLQEKKQEIKEALQEKKHEKPKKMTRVIASSSSSLDKKSAKKDKKDIITTSSWRAGQELVMKELGLTTSRNRRSSHNSEASLERDRENIPDGATSDLDFVPSGGTKVSQEVKDNTSSTKAELERGKALSEEARRILSDLHYDEDDFKENKSEKKEHKPPKRKAPKSHETEKQQPIAKHRHYDAEEVRRFMFKQKASRLKQQREEEQKQREAEQIRKKQLEELYNKQKQTAAASAHLAKKGKEGHEHLSKPRADETFVQSNEHPKGHLMEDSKHKHQDRERRELGVGSDHGDMDVGHEEDDGNEDEDDDGSSTLTGDSMDEAAETPRMEQQLSAKNPTTTSHSNDRDFLVEANIRSISGIKFDVDGVLSKFSQVLQNKASEPTGMKQGGHIGSSHFALSEIDPIRSKSERIEAIKATAATLQSRLQAETRKLTQHELPVSSTAGLGNRRPLPSKTGKTEQDEFTTRFERMIGADRDYNVFTSNLPGGRGRPTTGSPGNEGNQDDHMEAAAIRIQAAYRGHTVRQALNWKLPSGQTVLSSHRNKEEDESSITETSTFSDITITEDSENSGTSPQRPFGAGLRDRDFHAGAKKSGITEEPNFPLPRGAHGQREPYNWEEPKPDPYSVFSVFARKQRNQAKQRSAPVGEESRPGRSHAPVGEEEPIKMKVASTSHAAVKSSSSASTRVNSRSANNENRSQSPIVTQRHSPSPTTPVSSRSTHFSSITEFAAKARSEIQAKERQPSNLVTEKEESEDDTLKEDSLVKSVESEGDKTSGYKAKKRPIKPQPRSLSERREAADSDLSHDLEQSHDSSEHETPVKVPARYSPNTLERKFQAELNQLESMEESMRQLTSLERTRAVSMAQQESVSLAQLLKGRQQAHSQEMKELELKAQKEALEATKQLQEAKLRSMEVTHNAAAAIKRLSTDPENQKDQELAKSLMESQEEVSKATSEATMKLAQAKSLSESSRKIYLEDNIRPRRSKSSISERLMPDSARTLTGRSYSLDSRADRRTAKSSIRDSVRTASDTQRKTVDSDSSIQSISGAYGRDDSKSESIDEDISQASGDDYSVIFDETMTEDEVTERSFKAILPSESHRKRSKKHHADNVSVTSEEGSTIGAAASGIMDNLSNYFQGEDSFNKFTEEMVRQFMKEEEMRAQHQRALLQLREKALMEKTQTELEWLEQQKQRIRNKGADDAYPQLVKKQRGLKLRLQEQKAEIKKLREQNEAASRERKKILQQHKEISKIKQVTKQTKEKLKDRKSLGQSEAYTEDEDAAAKKEKRRKDYLSDSEIYNESVSRGSKKSRADSASLEKIKKLHLDEKFLTVREQKLLERKKNAEDLLKWKKRLDEEEAKIYQMEKEAMMVWDKKEEGKKYKQENRKKETASSATMQDNSVITESVLTAKDDSVRRTLTSTPRTDIASGSESSPEEAKRARDAKDISGSESSIQEEVPSTSIDEPSPSVHKVVRGSTVDSTIATENSYANDTFEDSLSKQAASKSKSGRSPRSPLARLTGNMTLLTSKDIHKSRFKGRSSESESEESTISHTETSYSENLSEASDHEGRVRALSEELRRRKIEADRLKRERKKRQKEILKSKEEALKKQIEAYDNTIIQLKADLQKEMEHEPIKSSVRPQIKQPKVSPSKQKKKDLTPPRSSASGSSVGEDNSSNQSSPSVIEDQKQSPISKSSVVTKSVQLEKISEGSGSDSSLAKQRLDKKLEPSPKRSSAFSESRDSTQEINSEDIPEDISVAESVSERSSVQFENVPIIDTTARDNDDYDVSYSEDFSATQTGSKQLPLHMRSMGSESKEPARTIRSTADEVSEQISERVASAISGDSQFVKPLNIEDNEDLSQVSPRSVSYSTNISDSRIESRPSSGKSISSRTLDESFDEGEPGVQDKGRESEEEISEVSTPAPSAKGAEEDEEEDEITPLNSPREDEIDIMVDFNLGDRVLVTGPRGTRRVGILMYKGKVKFAPGIWAGVELDVPEGRNDGSHENVRYFQCRPSHGVLVPGDDLMPAPALRSPRRSASQDSFASSKDDESVTEEEELIRSIQEADKSICDSQLTPRARLNNNRNAVADRITDDIFTDVVQSDVRAMSRIGDRRTPPPPLSPKPRKTEEYLVNGDLSPEISPDINQNDKRSRMTDRLTKNLLNDAIDDMISIRKNKRQQLQQQQFDSPRPSTQSHQLIDFSDDVPIEELSPESPTEELKQVMNHKDEEELDKDFPPRPLSPAPGSTPQHQQQHMKQLDNDINDLYGNDIEEEYIDDDQLLPSSAVNEKLPPPYPGSPAPEAEAPSRAMYPPTPEDTFFAIPREKGEIQALVSSAVDIFWDAKCEGETLEGVEPPDEFFDEEEDNNNDDIEAKSRRVYKKLLFDLTGEIMCDVYKQDEKETPPPYAKLKRTRHKYFNGATPPNSVDKLKPLVESAVMDILGINGTRKGDKNKWSVRKKKDHVDNILVDELREEEPEWVNYDDDEIAVKMNLTESIFEMLLTDTVQTMNRIHRKKQAMGLQN